MTTGIEWYRDDEQLLSELQHASQPKNGLEATETVVPEPAPGPLPKRIGQFHIKKVIAAGGMGTVYEAMQEHPRRTVAVKVMKQGIASRSTLRRFEFESQLLARLRHSGIAQVYEAGTHDDGAGAVPYFAMEYIPNARPITEYAKEKRLGTRERLQLFARVCDAVYHGHQKGIIHRDLKPGNILVDSNGDPKIIDFGVARGTDSDMAVTTLQTDVGQLVGTLQYMSPEQCAADPHDIDTRSDVYALGIVLYELLCERLPYTVTRFAMHEATRIIREQSPTRLSTVNKTLRGDVETIAHKALEKDRDRRYQSALEFAQDIRRYLSGEAIIARPPSIAYQLRVFARRHKAAFGAIAAVFVVLVAGLVISTALYMRAESARAEAAQERDRALRAEAMATAVNDFLINDMLASADPQIAQGRKITVEEVLDSAAQRVDNAFPNQPEIEASIQDTIGTTYVNLGLHEAAEPHLREAEATRKRTLGDEHPDTLHSRAQLADLLRRQGWYLQAESLARETLEVQRRVLGTDHPATAFTLNALGLVLRRQGNYVEAERVFRDVLEIRRRTLGEEHLDTLMSMSNLAKTLENMGWWPELAKGSGDTGKCDEIEALHRRVLNGQRRILGSEHPQTLVSMANLGLVLRCQGKVVEAERMIRQALDAQQRILGDEHPDTLQSMYNLAGVIWRSGRLDEAEELLKTTLAAQRRVLGVVNLTAISTTDFLLRILRARGKLEEARTYVARLIKEADQLRQEDLHTNPYEINAFAYARLTYEPVEFRNPAEALPLAERVVEITGGTPQHVRALAIAYEQNGRLDNAIRTQQKALARLEPGESYWRTVFETRLINTLRNSGDSDGADVVLREALARVAPAHRESHGDLIKAMTELAVLLLVKGRYLQHEWFCSELTEVRRGTIPLREPGIAGFVVIYAAALVEQGKNTEAEPYLRRCLDIRRLALPEGHWHTAHVASVLGTAFAGQGKYGEAEPLLLDAYETMKGDPQTPPARLTAALHRIVTLYEAWGRPDEASRWQAIVEPTDSASSPPSTSLSGPE